MKGSIIFLVCAMLALQLPAQNLVRAGNVQLVTQPNTQLVIKGGVRFTGTTDFTNKGAVTIYANPLSGTADWTDSTTAGVMNNASAGRVSFKGSSTVQQVYGPTRFDTLEVQSIGINLRQSNEVRQRLTLNNGLVYFTNTADSLYVSNPAVSSISYNTDSLTTSSWVHGKLSRRMNTAGSVYFFPVGKMLGTDSLYAPVKFEKTTSGPVTFSVQYIPQVPADRNNKNPIIDHISSLEYWEITSHNAGAAADDVVMSLSWRDYSDVNAAAIIRDSLLIAHYYFDGAVTQWQPELNTSVPNDVNGNINFGYIRSNKVVADFIMPHLYFTIGTRSPQNLLPVNFLSFNAVKQGQTAVCTWIIADDREVEEYIVERSGEGGLFTAIGHVSANQTGGSTAYYFTDQHPLAGRNYYRIKAVNTLTQRYTGIRSLTFDNNLNWVLYPNPATDKIRVRLPVINGTTKLSLLDATGRQISERLVSSTDVEININTLPRGLYYLRYINGSSADNKSFIKQ
ncbi:MAG: T9SS type A sorting domain-containing protein [Chitinophagaceae bacterium]|nr:T9SS type A sorting domain-containing protein [Chitinophagaceae bacterium]